MLEDSWSLYSLVQDDSELPLIEALEGRVAVVLGLFPEARTFLDSARLKLLARHRLIEAGVASLDLAALYAGASRAAEIAPLIADLKRASQGVGGGSLAAEALESFADGPLASPLARAALLRAQLLKRARLQSFGAPPLPWV